MSRCRVARQIAAASRPAAPVVILVDPRVRVLQLASALASSGLTLRHDPGRNALIVSSASTAPIQQI